MPRQTKEQKRLESLVDAAFKKLGNGVEFNIFDVGKVLDAKPGKLVKTSRRQ